MGVWMRSWAVAWLGMALLLAAGEARGGESYYVIIFGSQSRPKQFRHTHTWATFIRAVGEGPDPAQYAMELHTISWLPRSLHIRTWALKPEPGVNLDLYQTLDVVGRIHEEIVMWGPFHVDRLYFDRAIAVQRSLETGEKEYRAIDISLNLEVSDCIHAVAAVDPQFGRWYYPLIRVGIPASRFVARQYMLRTEYDQRQADNSWLIPRLGLDRYPIEIVPPRRIPERECFLCKCPE